MILFEKWSQGEAQKEEWEFDRERRQLVKGKLSHKLPPWATGASPPGGLGGSAQSCSSTNAHRQMARAPLPLGQEPAVKEAHLVVRGRSLQ